MLAGITLEACMIAIEEANIIAFFKACHLAADFNDLTGPFVAESNWSRARIKAINQSL